MKNRPERAVVRVAWLILKFYTPWNISGTAKARDQILYTGWPCEVLAFGRVSLTVHWCGQRTRRRSACGLHLRRSSASWLNAQVYYTLVDCNPLNPLLRYVLDLSYKLVLHCYSWQDSDWHIPSRGPSAVAELLAKSVVKLSIAHPCRSKTQLGLLPISTSMVSYIPILLRFQSVQVVLILFTRIYCELHASASDQLLVRDWVARRARRALQSPITRQRRRQHANWSQADLGHVDAAAPSAHDQPLNLAELAAAILHIAVIDLSCSTVHAEFQKTSTFLFFNNSVKKLTDFNNFWYV